MYTKMKIVSIYANIWNEKWIRLPDYDLYEIDDDFYQM